MKRAKNSILLLIAAIFVGGLLYAAPAGNFSGKKLTVGIWGGNSQETASIEKVKADFEAKTGAKVEFKVYTDYNTQLQADLIGKTAPDVFYIDANVFPFISSLEVLDPLDPKAMEADKFYANLLSAFTTNGKIYAMPKDMSTLAMYFNKTMLKDVGLTEKDIPDSLEALVKFLPSFQAKLDAKYGKGKVTAMSYNQDIARMLHLLERDGSVATADGNSTLSSSGVLKNLNFILSLVNTKAYKTPAELGAGWNGEAFGNGKVAIMEEGNWVYGYLKQNFAKLSFGVRNMPTYMGKRSSMYFTVGYGIYTRSKEKALAQEWIKYATGTEGMATWCSGVGTLPSRDDVAKKINVAADSVLAVHLAQQSYALPWQKGTTITIINSAFQNYFPAAVKGTSTLEAAMQAADKQANTQIANSR